MATLIDNASAGLLAGAIVLGGVGIAWALAVVIDLFLPPREPDWQELE